MVRSLSLLKGEGDKLRLDRWEALMHAQEGGAVQNISALRSGCLLMGSDDEFEFLHRIPPFESFHLYFNS